MKNIAKLILFIMIIMNIGCKKEKQMFSTVVPPIEGAKLKFYGYVTNKNFEILLSIITKFLDNCQYLSYISHRFEILFNNISKFGGK